MADERKGAVTLRGNPVTLAGPEIKAGQPAPDFTAVKTLSDFREHSFGESYGVLITDGPLAGLNARAVFVVGKDGTVRHVEYVKDITQEPNYDAALNAAKQAAGG